MIWITRAGGNVDRVAFPCPGKRFLDSEAQFRFGLPDAVLETAKLRGGKS